MRRTLLAVAIIALALQDGRGQSSVLSGLPLPQCQQLLVVRQQVELHGQAIRSANQQKASTLAGCRLFQAYLAAELRLLNALQADGTLCGVPPEIAPQIKSSHAKASQIGTDVCKAAGIPLDENQPRGPGDFWTPAELDRAFGRPRFEAR